MTLITQHDIAEARLRRLIEDYQETLGGIIDDCGEDFTPAELAAIYDHVKATVRLSKTLGAESA